MAKVNDDSFERASRIDAAALSHIPDTTSASPLESAVSVELNTGSVPAAQANTQRFTELLRKHLHTELGDELKMFIYQNKISIDNMSLKELDSVLPMSIKYRDGTIDYTSGGRVQYVSISFITISALGNALKVGVYGTSEEAEKVLGKTYETIFEAAGIKRQWAEAQDEIVAKGYATSSIETFDAGLQTILSQPFNELLFNEINGARIGKLGILPINSNTGKPIERQYQAVVKLGHLVFDVIRMDPSSGDRYSSTISIKPRTSVDVGLGQYIVTTEFEYKDHQALVKSLKKVLS